MGVSPVSNNMLKGEVQYSGLEAGAALRGGGGRGQLPPPPPPYDFFFLLASSAVGHIHGDNTPTPL